jgi:hypothetical protein
MLNTTYQMFDLAHRMISIKKPGFRGGLPFSSKPTKQNDNLIQLPPANDPPKTQTENSGGAPWLSFFEQIDMNQLFSILQSPFIQKLISNFFQEPRATTSIQQRKRG